MLIKTETREISDYLIAMAFSGGLTAVATWTAAKWDYYRIPENSESKSTSIEFKDVFGAFVVFLGLGFVFIPIMILLLFPMPLGSSVDGSLPARPWLDIFLILLTGSLFGVYCLTRSKSVLHEIWGKRGLRHNLQDLAMGFATWFVCYPLVMFVNQLISLLMTLFIQAPQVDQVAVRHLRATLDNPLLFAATAGLIVLVVPLIEEMLFRGFLQTWLRSILGRMRAVVITSIVFAIFHFSFSQGWDNVELLSSLFVLSCFLGFIYERQGSLWASVGLHGVFNAISVLLILLSA